MLKKYGMIHLFVLNIGPHVWLQLVLLIALGCILLLRKIKMTPKFTIVLSKSLSALTNLNVLLLLTFHKNYFMAMALQTTFGMKSATRNIVTLASFAINLLFILTFTFMLTLAFEYYLTHSARMRVN
jgi:hypothetical protein